MKKIPIFLSVFLLLTVVMSCNNKQSLQSYLVETSGKEGFYTADLPVSSVLNGDLEVSEDVQKTIKSIKKVNLAFLAKTEDNEEAYQVEKNKLEDIFKDNSTYKNLMAMKMQGMNVKIFYSGKADAIDEVIAFGYSKDAGVGVARLLGENMNPAQVMAMMNGINTEKNKDALESFTGIFKD